MNNKIKLLEEQISNIDSLKHRPAYHPEYSIWDNTTKKLLSEIFDESYLKMYGNIRVSRIARSDEEIFNYFINILDNKKTFLLQAINEHKRLNQSNIIDISRNPNLLNYDFHSDIKEVSLKLFEDKHYSQAVEEAFKKVIKEVKGFYHAQTGNYLDGDSLMNKVFGCENQIPMIKFNNLSSIEEKDEQKGIMYLFKGIVGIRNNKAHDNVILDDSNRAIEYLALASLLMRLFEKHKV